MRTLALVAALLAPLAAMAAPPAYFTAPKGAKVRAAPEAEAKPVGALPPGAGPIEAVEEDGWLRLTWGEGDGWVRRDALSPTEVPRLGSTALPLGLVCAGTEPFWSITLGDGARFATPEGGRSYAIEGAATAEGRLSFPVAVRLAAEDGGGTAVIRPLTCNDGMSDRTWPWTVDLLLRQGTEWSLLTGCCRLPRPE